MGTIRFVLRLDKSLKNNTAPIDLIYQVQGQRKYFRTDVKLPTFSNKDNLLYWNAENQKALFVDRKRAKSLLPNQDFDLLPTAAEIEDYNNSLKELCATVATIEKRFKMDGIPYSSQMVVDKIKEGSRGATKKEVNSNVVFEFMQSYLDENKKTRGASSLAVYRAVKNYLEKYCKTTGKTVTFQNIDYRFFQSFQSYLLQEEFDETGKVTKRLNNTTVAKQLSTLKTFLNYAKMQGHEVSQKYKDFKIKRETLEVIALTSDEFERLYRLDLSENKRMAETRDVFCFSCTTGLRYSDLAQLKRVHIKDSEIQITIKKTKDLLIIPLNSYSKAILAKYKDNHKPLPVISNQNLNYAIKTLCELAEINENIEIVRFRGVQPEKKIYKKYQLIGVHTGRKTFCTLSLEKGMSTEQVMAISGHRDYKSFSRYVKVTEQLKKVVMLKAWDRVEENKLKAV